MRVYSTYLYRRGSQGSSAAMVHCLTIWRRSPEKLRRREEQREEGGCGLSVHSKHWGRAVLLCVVWPQLAIFTHNTSPAHAFFCFNLPTRTWTRLAFDLLPAHRGGVTPALLGRQKERPDPSFLPRRRDEARPRPTFG